MVDINLLAQTVDLPVISVVREKPDLKTIRKALKNLPESERRWKAIKSAGKIIEVQIRETDAAVYMQIAEISEEDAEKILKNTSTQSNIPEALRVAHIIASGLTRSEEKV